MIASAEKSVTNATAPALRRSLFSYLTLSWLNPTLRLGVARPLCEEDLPPLPESESSFSVMKRGEVPSALLRIVAPPFLATMLLSGVIVAITIVLPLTIGRIINALAAASDGPSKEALILSAMFVLLQLASAFITSVTRSIKLSMAIRLNVFFTNLVYRKALRLAPQSKTEFPPATINSFINADIPNFQEVPNSFILLITYAVQIALAIYYLANSLGVAIWVGIGAYLGLFVSQMVLFPIVFKGQMSYLKALDDRTKYLRELLYGISVIKLQAAEESLGKSIAEARQRQLHGLRQFIFALLLIFIVLTLQQFSLPPITFIAYFAFGNGRDPATIFSSLGLLYTLIEPSSMFGGLINVVMQSFASYKRMFKFFDAKDVQLDEITEILSATSAKHAVSLEKVTFTWEQPIKAFDDDENDKGTKLETGPADDVTIVQGEQNAADEPNNTIFTLDNLDLSIPRGSFVAVVGSVGSGKTSLLEALVGSMRKTSGSSRLYGKVAYCTQEPWILSGTIEDNILFGRTDDATRSRLSAAVDASCLAHDLALMPAGLGTQIGEKGIMLSGGQRARVALARALAHDADVVLLDDPLAALDAHVGHTVLDKAICGMLKSKTVVLVTHQLHVLPKTDLVVVMDGGKIVETGAFRDLMAKQDGALAKMMSGYHFDEHTESKQDSEQTPDKLLETTADDDKALAEALKKYEEEKAIEEDRRKGAVTLNTFKSYFVAAGLWLTVLCLTAFALAIGSGTLNRIMLAVWSDHAWGWSDSHYFYFYIGSSLFDALFISGIVSFAFLAGYFASVHFHDKALSGLIHAPMHFFDGQPIGRILNRMTADVKNLDMNLSMELVNVLGCAIPVFSSLVIQIYASPYISILIVVLIVVYGYIFRYFQASYREFKRLQSIMKSPLLSHVSESLNGISIIRAYAATDVFISQQRYKLDRSNTSVFLLNSTQIWITLWFGVISTSISLALLLIASSLTSKLSVSAIGLALSSIFEFGMSFNMMLMALGEAEASFNSVERLNHYAHDLPSEAPRQLPTDPDTDVWPTKGAISFKDLEIRYPSRPDHAVIDHLSIDILPGEKVAVVGRTGSGKSTLTTALFRIVEASSGSITVDGVDIAKLGLRTLRSRLQIIPQEPVLFDGTIRSNIDLHGSHSDDEALWNALETVGLKDYVASLDGKLDAHVDEGGSNLSAGQRQLLCLCRAILAKPKVLVMDEATASVDADADRRIQAAVTSEFRNTTVLSIAHRLNTIAAYDKVVVLDAGKVVECDAPHVLLEKSGSVFGRLVDATGQANSAAIRTVASIHYAGTKKD